MLSNDSTRFRKACISTTQKRNVKTHALSLLGTTRILSHSVCLLRQKLTSRKRLFDDVAISCPWVKSWKKSKNPSMMTLVCLLKRIFRVMSATKTRSESKAIASASGNKSQAAPAKPPRLMTPTKVTGSSHIAEQRNCAAQIPTASMASK